MKNSNEKFRKLIENIVKEEVEGWSTKIHPTHSGMFKLQLFKSNELFDEREISSKHEIPSAIKDMMEPEEKPLLLTKRKELPVPLLRKKIHNTN